MGTHSPALVLFLGGKGAGRRRKWTVPEPISKCQKSGGKRMRHNLACREDAMDLAGMAMAESDSHHKL